MQFIVLMLVLFYVTSGHRHRRYRSFSDDSSDLEIVPNLFPVKTPACDLACFGQWKSDFQLTFQKNYDTDYFDVPLDDIIIGSKQTLNSFCSVTQQKFDCYTRECEIARIDWSADRHICSDHLEDFRENHACLSKTAKIVRRECTDVCNNIPIILSAWEKNYIRHKMHNRQQEGFVEQNQNCHFIACHQMCHEQVITHICDENEREKSREVVHHYYDSYLKKEWKDVQGDNELIFSSFCRRVTAGFDENSTVGNMTRFNNQVLDRIKMEIKSMIGTLP